MTRHTPRTIGDHWSEYATLAWRGRSSDRDGNMETDHDLEACIHQRLHLFRVHPLGKRGKTGQVGEHHRDLFEFPFFGNIRRLADTLSDLGGKVFLDQLPLLILS